MWRISSRDPDRGLEQSVVDDEKVTEELYFHSTEVMRTETTCLNPKQEELKFSSNTWSHSYSYPSFLAALLLIPSSPPGRALS